ncbi:MAG: hypothetical protein Greene041662_945 [Candidatus Peregrinibacteria bacterium Greene0416_62]|nr:MAG: hypothetical protein Greene041662_945 [Candidatus Peregrinibacteria bacterium Greene0416_62]
MKKFHKKLYEQMYHPGKKRKSHARILIKCDRPECSERSLFFRSKASLKQHLISRHPAQNMDLLIRKNLATNGFSVVSGPVLTEGLVSLTLKLGAMVLHSPKSPFLHDFITTISGNVLQLDLAAAVAREATSSGPGQSDIDDRIPKFFRLCREVLNCYEYFRMHVKLARTAFFGSDSHLDVGSRMMLIGNQSSFAQRPHMDTEYRGLVSVVYISDSPSGKVKPTTVCRMPNGPLRGDGWKSPHGAACLDIKDDWGVLPAATPEFVSNGSLMHFPSNVIHYGPDPDPTASIRVALFQMGAPTEIAERENMQAEHDYQIFQYTVEFELARKHIERLKRSLTSDPSWKIHVTSEREARQLQKLVKVLNEGESDAEP